MSSHESHTMSILSLPKERQTKPQLISSIELGNIEIGLRSEIDTSWQPELQKLYDKLAFLCRTRWWILSLNATWKICKAVSDKVYRFNLLFCYNQRVCIQKVAILWSQLNVELRAICLYKRNFCFEKQIATLRENLFFFRLSFSGFFPTLYLI